MPPLSILYEDDQYIAVNKPAGMLVHRTPLEKDPEALVAMVILRDQIGQKVYPLHRLDRPTSGVLLFAKSSEAASRLQPAFADHRIQKYYLAVVRGYLSEPEGIIDQPLSKDLEHEPQDAISAYWRLAEVEIPFSSSNRYGSSRYSLVKVYPHTGRMHQIRRHFAHIRHYIIGDTTHGDNKQNKFFRRHFKSHHLMLHAWILQFIHPYTGELVVIKGQLSNHLKEMIRSLGWKDILDTMNQ
jgi:tRNA pseudouridine65 synthase